MVQHVQVTPDVEGPSVWERRADLMIDWSAYVLLTVGLVLVLAQPQTLRDRAVALALAALAAAWITVYMRMPGIRRGEHQVAAAGYFFGLVVIGAVMMLHHPLFFPVLITGFFHAYILRPWPVVFLGIGLTSLVLNSQVAEQPADPTATELLVFLVIVAVQTVAISGGVMVGQKTTDLLCERRETVAQLQAALRENEGLHVQLMTQAHEAGVLDERQRLAREIHDTLAQGLTGIITQLEAATRTRDDAADHRRHIDVAMRLARDSLADARRSVLELAPEPLENARLPEALAEVGRRWSSGNGVTAEVITTGSGQRLHPATEVTLLRVAQEALANVARHANASRVGVTLSYMDNVVTLDVRDDGAGFVPPAAAATNGGGPSGGFGLTAMRQRLAQVGGVLAIESEPGAGTSISASVPALPPGLQLRTDTGASDAAADRDEGAHRR